MVEALYLPHNYELTTALVELKDHYVTVNHYFRFGVKKNKSCSDLLPAGPCPHGLNQAHLLDLTFKKQTSVASGRHQNQLKELKDVETIKEEASQ